MPDPTSYSLRLRRLTLPRIAFGFRPAAAQTHSAGRGVRAFWPIYAKETAFGIRPEKTAGVSGLLTWEICGGAADVAPFWLASGGIAFAQMCEKT